MSLTRSIPIDDDGTQTTLAQMAAAIGVAWQVQAADQDTDISEAKSWGFYAIRQNNLVGPNSNDYTSGYPATLDTAVANAKIAASEAQTAVDAAKQAWDAAQGAQDDAGDALNEAASALDQANGAADRASSSYNVIFAAFDAVPPTATQEDVDNASAQLGVAYQAQGTATTVYNNAVPTYSTAAAKTSTSLGALQQAMTAREKAYNVLAMANYAKVIGNANYEAWKAASDTVNNDKNSTPVPYTSTATGTLTAAFAALAGLNGSFVPYSIAFNRCNRYSTYSTDKGYGFANYCPLVQATYQAVLSIPDAIYQALTDNEWSVKLHWTEISYYVDTVPVEGADPPAMNPGNPLDMYFGVQDMDETIDVGGGTQQEDGSWQVLGIAHTTELESNSCPPSTYMNLTLGPPGAGHATAVFTPSVKITVVPDYPGGPSIVFIYGLQTRGGTYTLVGWPELQTFGSAAPQFYSTLTVGTNSDLPPGVNYFGTFSYGTLGVEGYTGAINTLSNNLYGANNTFSSSIPPEVGTILSSTKATLKSYLGAVITLSGEISTSTVYAVAQSAAVVDWTGRQAAVPSMYIGWLTGQNYQSADGRQSICYTSRYQLSYASNCSRTAPGPNSARVAIRQATLNLATGKTTYTDLSKSVEFPKQKGAYADTDWTGVPLPDLGKLTGMDFVAMNDPTPAVVIIVTDNAEEGS